MTGRATLAGKVCIVTGATRGIGKGVALQLGQAGATVYITGRTLKRGPKDKGSLEDTAAEIESRGGRCIPVVCDHANDDDIQKLFERVSSEQSGQLDVLVNNAYSAVGLIAKYMGVPFWEAPLSTWDDVNNVGLRNHYQCTVLASRLMVPRKKGLIVNISSAGGLRYLFNVPYGIGKEALDRMAVDCGIELRKHNVAVVSLWPGPVRTEQIMSLLEKDKELAASATTSNKSVTKIFLTGRSESLEFAGKAVAHLAADPKIMAKTSRILMTAELGSEYGFTDDDGQLPDNMRSLSFVLSSSGYRLGSYIPSWIKIPYFLFYMGGYKF